ncbi:cadherin-7-like, partial [Leptonychotes weddellii]|uniref:Cadherin-7-like n=1 Tax=Leptonychotes weddellii TaxID=9713 RepID=A0A7F8RDM8_LEPWE
MACTGAYGSKKDYSNLDLEQHYQLFCISVAAGAFTMVTAAGADGRGGFGVSSMYFNKNLQSLCHSFYKLHSDVDKGDGSIKYILSGEGASSIFIIDENTGDIHATKRLDREEQAYYTLRAQALDRLTNKPVEPESEFVIKIQDINDNEPKFLDGPYTAGVPEMSPVGTSVVQVTATDADDPTYGNSARVVYSILQGQPYFSVEPKT